MFFYNGVELSPGNKVFLRDGYVSNFPATFKRHSGEPFDVKMNIVGVHEGKELRLLGMMEDLSTVNDIKEEMEAAKEKFAFLYKNSHDAIMQITSPEWRFTAGNPATIKMFQVKDEDEFESLAPWELSPKYQPDGRLSVEKAKEMIDWAVKYGSSRFEWVHKRHNGEEFSAEVFLTRMESHGVSFLQAIVRDISDQKKAENSLRDFIEKTKKKISTILPVVKSFVPNEKDESGTRGKDELEYLFSSLGLIVSSLEERTTYLDRSRKAMVNLSLELAEEKNKLTENSIRLGTILRSIGDGVFVVDRDGIITFCNPTVANISGYSEDEVIGQKCCTKLRFYSSEKETDPNEDIREAMKTGIGRNMPAGTILQKKDGKKYRFPLLSLRYVIKIAKLRAVLWCSEICLKSEVLMMLKVVLFLLHHTSFGRLFQRFRGLWKCFCRGMSVTLSRNSVNI